MNTEVRLKVTPFPVPSTLRLHRYVEAGAIGPGVRPAPAPTNAGLVAPAAVPSPSSSYIDLPLGALSRGALEELCSDFKRRVMIEAGYGSQGQVSEEPKEAG